ncbi:MAG: SdrD B-like domain-containing protein [Planctomycetaceae bacterium]
MAGITIYLDLNDNALLDGTGEISLEPDNYPNMDVSNVLPEVTLTAEYGSGQTSPVGTIQVPSGTTSTGQYAFTYDADGTTWSKSSQFPARMKVELNGSVPSVSLDFTAATANTAGLLQAFDAAGNLIASKTTGVLALNQFGTVTIFAPGMAYLYATSANAGSVVLDNLRLTTEIEPFAVTDAVGDYTFTDVPAGDYVVREVVPDGYRKTFPVTEIPRLFAIDFNPSSPSRIVEVDPQTGLTLASFVPAVGAITLTSGLAFDGNSLFLVDANTDTLYKLNPDTGAVLGSLGLDATGRWDGVAALNGSIYVNDPFADVIEVVDPVTMTLTSTIQLSAGGNFNPFGGLGELPDAAGGQLVGAVGSSNQVALLNPADGSVNSTFTHAPVSNGDNFGITSVSGEIYLGFNDLSGTVLVYAPDGTLIRSFQTGFDMSGLGGGGGADGSHRITVGSSPTITGLDFGNIRATGSISGTKFEDTNANGVRDSGENPVSGVTVYLDSNDNGMLDAGELFDVTDTGGNFLFMNLPTGDYTIRELVPAGHVETAPGNRPAFFYGVDAGPDNLVTIDAATGQVSTIGALGANIHGLTVTRNGELYALSGTNTDGLYSVDPATGQATLIGAVGRNAAWGLAYDPLTDTLYGAGSTTGGNGLMAFDRATGAGTVIGPGNPGMTATSGVSFDPVRRKFLLFDNADDEFYEFDLTNGVATLLSVANPAFNAYGFATFGSEFVMPTQNATGLMIVDPITGAQSPLLSLSQVTGLDALEYVAATDGAYRVTVLADRIQQDLNFGSYQPSAGVVTSDTRISNTAGSFTAVLENFDQFGAAVTSVGDLDHDGIPDLVVGAPGDDDGGPSRGAVYVLFLNADGSVRSHQKISDSEGGFGGVLGHGDEFGRSLAKLGDLNGDQVVDIVAGAPGDDDGGTDRGAVYTLFLNPDGSVKSAGKIGDASGPFAGSLDDSDGFGTSVASIGDLDGDGVRDMVVGAPFDDDGGTDRGAAYVLFMNANATVKALQKISNTSGNFTAALLDGDSFASSVAGVGDLDADGVPDLAVGASGDDDGSADGGAIYVLFLNSDGTVKSHQKISSTTGGFSAALDVSDQFGSSITAIGDLDGDYVTDLVVGALGDDDGGTDRGAAYVLLMHTDGTVKSQQKVSDTQGSFTGALNNADNFGAAVSYAGDLNGDGVSELVVGIPGRDDGGANRGAISVLQVAGVTRMQVRDLQVSSTSWSAAFRDTSDGAPAGSGAGIGYSVLTGAATQTKPLPWSNIRRLVVTFSQDIDAGSVVANGNVSIHAVNSSPSISQINVVGNQMIIDLNAALPVDALRLEIQDTVLSVSGDPLDGDFVNQVDSVSGGPAPQGHPANDFNFHFVVNPGDANRSGLVNISDAVLVFQNFLAQPGGAGYSLFADMNGDAILNISDAVIVFQHFLAMPPTSFPGLFGPGFASSEWYPAPPTAPPSVPTTASSGSAGTYQSSRTSTQTAALAASPEPASPPDSDLQVLDEVLSESVDDLLTP